MWIDFDVAIVVRSRAGPTLLQRDLAEDRDMFDMLVLQREYGVATGYGEGV